MTSPLRSRVLALLLGACALTSMEAPLRASDRGDYLTYDAFISEVESGLVKSATLDHFSQITGTHFAGGEEHAFSCYAGSGSASDKLLIRLLNQKQVAITLKERKDHMNPFAGPEMFGALLIFLVPILTLVLAFCINSKLNRLTRLSWRLPPSRPDSPDGV